MKLFVGLLAACVMTTASAPMIQTCFRPLWPKIQLTKAEMQCLTQNLHYEALGEGFEGMKAVAHVTINRLMDKRYPKDVCKIVHQPAQFSWTLTNERQYRIFHTAYSAAQTAIDDWNYYRGDPTNGALWFHSTKITPPDWAAKFRKVNKIGNHIFYTDTRM